jgi:hypothetical protein
MSELTLNSLLVPSKEIEVDYPGLDGFKVKLAFLSREELIKIRKKATKIVFKNRQPSDEFNEELFLKLYVDAVVKGWFGLKYKYLNELVLVDLSKVKDMEACLDFSVENALLLMKNSTEFDAFISETISDLQAFTKTS